MRGGVEALWTQEPGHSDAFTRSAARRAMDDLGEMDCPVLKRLLKDDSAKCLVLDCRSFLAFSAGHIRGAVNARCNTIVRRRAKGAALSLDQILAGDDEARARLRSGMYSAAVLYDERTPDAETVKEDSTLALVLNALCGDSADTSAYLLKGKGVPRYSPSVSCTHCGHCIPGFSIKSSSGGFFFFFLLLFHVTDEWP